MIEIVETLGRLMSVLVDIGIVKREQSVWILEPLENKAESEGRIRMSKKIKIELPENATNGDMIKTMFPNISIYEHGATYSVNNEYDFNSTWWNTPYKAESEKTDMEFSYKPINPFQNDGLSKEDKAMIDGMRYTAFVCGCRGGDVEFAVNKVLKRMGRLDLLPSCEQTESEDKK